MAILVGSINRNNKNINNTQFTLINHNCLGYLLVIPYKAMLLIVCDLN